MSSNNQEQHQSQSSEEDDEQDEEEDQEEDSEDQDTRDVVDASGVSAAKEADTPWTDRIAEEAGHASGGGLTGGAATDLLNLSSSQPGP